MTNDAGVDRAPRVSIVVPAFNAERFVEATLDSVRSQTFARWECVVIDDGSTDRTASRLDGFRSDGRFRIVHQDNHGMCATRNIGFTLTSSTSEYLVFLDSDDVLAPEFLERLVAHMDTHADAGLTYCSFTPIDAAGSPIGGFENRTQRAVRGRGFRVRHLALSEPECPLDALVSCHWAIPSCSIIRRRAYEQTTGWDRSSPRLADDEDMVFQIERHWAIHFLPDRLVSYRRHDGNISNSGTVERDRLTRRFWWDHPATDDASRARFRRAVVFDARLNGGYQLRAALSELCRGQLRTGTIHALRGGRGLVDAVVLGVCARSARRYPERWMSFARPRR